jgi:hypothetical protein
MVGTGGYGTTGVVHTAGVTNNLGLLVKAVVNKDTAGTFGPNIWVQTSATIALTSAIFITTAGSTNTLGIGNYNSGTPIFSTKQYSISINTDYTVAVIAGGFNSSGEAYKSGDTAADFLYGVAWYFNNGGTWELIARDWRQTAATYYPIAQTYSTVNKAKVDNFIVADGDTDLIGTMTPAHLSLFNGTDGDLLTTEYTPDIGNVWTLNAITKIVSNALHPASATSGGYRNTTETSIADGFFQMSFLWSYINNSNFWQINANVRYVDSSNFLYCDVYQTQFLIGTAIAGSYTTRANVAHGMSDQTEHVMTARVEGANMTCWVDGLKELSYGAAPFTTETTKAIAMSAVGSPAQTTYIKDFAVWPITGTQYDVLDNYTGAT